MHINKTLVLSLLFLCGCQEPKDLVPVTISQPVIIHSTSGDYVNTDKGQVYLVSNPTEDMSKYLKAIEPDKNVVLFEDNSNSSKDINNENMPNVKYGMSEDSKSIVLQQDDGGQYAFSIPNVQQTGIYGNNTVYPSLNLNSSPDNTALNVLYSPTVKVPNGCLEFGSNYWRGSGANSQTYHYVRLYDFCNNVGWGTNVAMKVDSLFIQSYVRNLGNGTPQYTFEITGTKEKGWSLYLYNYHNQIWDFLYRSGPGLSTYNGGEGWSLFETHYTDGPCTQTPVIISSGLSILQGNTWVNPKSIVNTFGNCFSTVGGKQTNSGISNNNGWQVISN